MQRTERVLPVDLLIVGAGAAGLAAAVRARDQGIDKILVVDRDPFPGGILRQCIHTGFGLEYFKQDLTGPEYLARLVHFVRRREIELRLDTTVIDLQPGPQATLISQVHGITQVRARAVILATGSYERTRENLQIAGTRPAGVFTAGQAQQLINLYGYRIGTRAVVQGTGDIGLIMTRRLLLEGYEIAGMFERLPFVAGLLRNKVQCLDDFDLQPQFEHQIVEIHGASRVSGVTVARVRVATDESPAEPVTGTERYVACDTVVLSAGLIPNRELLGRDTDHALNAALQAGNSNVFLAGNAVEIHDLADGASAQGEFAADRAVERLSGRSPRYAEQPHSTGEFVSPWSVPARGSDSGGVVCIVCPKGCVLTDHSNGCRRGADFLRQEREQKQRILTTTRWVKTGGKTVRVAVRSATPLPFARQPDVVRRIKHCTHDPQSFQATRVSVPQ